MQRAIWSVARGRLVDRVLRVEVDFGRHFSTRGMSLCCAFDTLPADHEAGRDVSREHTGRAPDGFQAPSTKASRSSANSEGGWAFDGGRQTGRQQSTAERQAHFANGLALAGRGGVRPASNSSCVATPAPPGRFATPPPRLRTATPSLTGKIPLQTRRTEQTVEPRRKSPY